MTIRQRIALTAWLGILAIAPLVAQDGTVRIGGDVPRPLTLSVAELAALPHTTLTASAHDERGEFSGVPVADLLKRAGLAMGDALRGPALAKYVVVTAADGYRVVFALAELDEGFTDRVILLADRRDGKPLPSNAGPLQIVVPGEKRPARWVRQVVSIEVR